MQYIIALPYSSHSLVDACSFGMDCQMHLRGGHVVGDDAAGHQPVAAAADVAGLWCPALPLLGQCALQGQNI